VVFNKVPEAEVVKNRVQLDIVSNDFDNEADWLIRLSATSCATWPVTTHGGGPSSIPKVTNST
jgi:hypothetical protein